MCSNTCGQGTRTRHRFCNRPPPSNGGLQCIGDLLDSVACYLRDCPVGEFFPKLILSDGGKPFQDGSHAFAHLN